MAQSQLQKNANARNGLPHRSKWAIYLAACVRQQLLELAEQLSGRYTVRTVKPAESGLGMLQISDSVSREAFHLGEFTVSTAVVEIEDAAGNKCVGGSAIMLDDEQLVSVLAIFDAVLQNKWEGSEEVLRLMQEGQSRLSRVDEARRCVLAATAVDFSTLDEDA